MPFVIFNVINNFLNAIFRSAGSERILVISTAVYSVSRFVYRYIPYPFFGMYGTYPAPFFPGLLMKYSNYQYIFKEIGTLMSIWFLMSKTNDNHIMSHTKNIFFTNPHRHWLLTGFADFSLLITHNIHWHLTEFDVYFTVA